MSRGARRFVSFGAVLATLVIVLPSRRCLAADGASAAQVDEIMKCFRIRRDLKELIHQTLWALSTNKDPAAKPANEIVRQTHRLPDFLSTMRRELSKLPSPVAARVVAFCRSEVGKAYTAAMAEYDPKHVEAQWPDVSHDASRVRLATALFDATASEQTTYAVGIAMLRNSGMAYRAVLQTRKHPHWPPLMWKTLNTGWKKEAEQTVLDNLKGSHFRSNIRSDDIQYLAVVLRNTPEPRIQALIAFFRSPPGRAVERAMDHGYRAAMDDAYDRIMARFDTGHPEAGLTVPKPPSRPLRCARPHHREHPPRPPALSRTAAARARARRRSSGSSRC